MVLPLIPIFAGMAIGGTAVSGAFQISRAAETRKYWHDYAKHTNRKVKYPNRSGYNDIYNAVGGTVRNMGYAGSFGYSSYGRYQSSVIRSMYR